MNLNFRGLLYSLERQWPATIDYVQIVESVTDTKTGSRAIKKVVFPLKCILLPADQIRKFIQDIGYLAANKNFTYGAVNDFNNQRFLLPMYNVPKGLNIDLNGYINYNGKRFEKLSFNQYADLAYVLVVRGTEGTLNYGFERESAFNTLQIQGRATFEVN